MPGSRTLWGVVLSLLSCAALAAQPLPLTPEEFQVNAYTTKSQGYPVVAVAPDGRFIVAWEGERSAGFDSSLFSVQARRFAADGTPLASDFQVNTYTLGYQDSPAAAMAPGGEFVVAWESAGSAGSDQSDYSIQARRYDSSGTPLDGADFQVNTYTTSYQRFPSVAVAPSGDFVVVWQSDGSAGSDDFAFSIQARRFGSDGAPLDPADFQVNTDTTSWQVEPEVAIDGAANFVVVWHSWSSSGGDTSGASIHARRFAADGAPLDANDFQVNTYTTNWQGTPAVAMAATGDFVVVWESFGSASGDTSEWSLQGRRFAADGTPLDAADFQVNAYTSGAQTGAAVAFDPRGGFAVSWQSAGSAGDDTSAESVQARRFAASGAPLDPTELQLNRYTTGEQRHARVAYDGAGIFVVAWESAGSAGSDTSYESVQARRFDGLFLFSDGFESGDLSRWSSAVP